MEPRRQTYRYGALLGLFLLIGAAWSQPAQGANPEVREWNRRLTAARTQLLAGKFKEALDIARPLQLEMMDRIQAGSGAGKGLAITVLTRALAEAGLGDMEAASWDWYTAQALDFSIATVDLTPFGAAGEALKTLGPLGEHPEPDPDVVKDASKSCDPQKEKCVQRPELIKRADLSYPDALEAVCAEGTVLVESIIDEEGKVEYPQLKESPGGPVMALAALESLRSWRFKPATFEGKPIKVYYTLTANFKATSRRCMKLKRQRAG